MEQSFISMLERLTPPADDAEPDWDDVLLRVRLLTGGRKTRAQRSRLAAAFAAVAVAAALAATTPVGPAIAHTFNDLSGWFTGKPGRLYEKLKETPFASSLLPAGLHTVGPATSTQRASVPGWDIVWEFGGSSGGSAEKIVVDYYVADNQHIAKRDFFYFGRRVRRDHPNGSRVLRTPWRTAYPTIVIQGGMRPDLARKNCPSKPNSCFVQTSVTRIRNVNIYVVAGFKLHSRPAATMRTINTAAIDFLLTVEGELKKTG